MKPASRKPIVISFHSICQSPRKLCATSDQALRAREALAPAHLARRPCGAGGRSRPAGRARAPAASSRGETNSRSSAHISAIITMPPTYSASVNCQPISTQSTSPSSQTRLVEANWKASAEAARGALLEQRLGDRDRRVGARRRGGAEPGRLGHRPEALARRAPPRSARAAPTPARPPRSRSRARAPTRPPTPSGRRSRGRRRAWRSQLPTGRALKLNIMPLSWFSAIWQWAIHRPTRPYEASCPVRCNSFVTAVTHVSHARP